MSRPAFLTNLTHRFLWTVTLLGTVALGVYWIALREPAAEWRLLLLGLLLAIALGLWPAVAAGTGAVLAIAAWFFVPAGMDRLLVVEEILCFSALGLGWGILLRQQFWPKVVLPSHPHPTIPHVPPVRRPLAPSSVSNFDSDSDRASSTDSSGASVSDGSTFVPPSIPPPPPPTAFAPSPTHLPASAASSAPPPRLYTPPPAPPPSLPAAYATPAPSPMPPPSSQEPLTDVFDMPTLGKPEAKTPDRPHTPPQRPGASPSPLSDSLTFGTPAPPPAPPEPVKMAAPLMTQEVDLGDFRAFVASQQPSSMPDLVPSEEIPLPVNRISGKSPEARTPLAPPPPPGLDPASAADSSVGTASEADARRTSFQARPETVAGKPYEVLLEWYNQFSWSPWTPDELEKRYHRLGQKVSWDTLALQDLVRAWKHWSQGLRPSGQPEGYITLHELEGFLRCETLGLLRHQGAPDHNVLSRDERTDAWMAVYRETRGRARGGSPLLRPIPSELVAFDPERLLAGRPDALIEIAGESDVIAFTTPFAPDEPMAWNSVIAIAQHKIAERMGLLVTTTPIVICLPMTHWDDRKQPRLHQIDDLSAEVRRLDGALERFLRVRNGTVAPRPQTRASVCNGCPSRHFCPSYAGTRSRKNLGDPPALLTRFLQQP